LFAHGRPPGADPPLHPRRKTGRSGTTDSRKFLLIREPGETVRFCSPLPRSGGEGAACVCVRAQCNPFSDPLTPGPSPPLRGRGERDRPDPLSGCVYEFSYGATRGAPTSGDRGATPFLEAAAPLLPGGRTQRVGPPVGVEFQARQHLRPEPDPLHVP